MDKEKCWWSSEKGEPIVNPLLKKGNRLKFLFIYLGLHQRKMSLSNARDMNMVTFCTSPNAQEIYGNPMLSAKEHICICINQYKENRLKSNAKCQRTHIETLTNYITTLFAIFALENSNLFICSEWLLSLFTLFIFPMLVPNIYAFHRPFSIINVLFSFLRVSLCPVLVSSVISHY